jgi:hypothetical protein
MFVLADRERWDAVLTTENNFWSFLLLLKVVGNEKNGGSGRSLMLQYGAGPWRLMFIYNLNMQF